MIVGEPEPLTLHCHAVQPFASLICLLKAFTEKRCSGTIKKLNPQPEAPVLGLGMERPLGKQTCKLQTSRES